MIYIFRVSAFTLLLFSILLTQSDCLGGRYVDDIFDVDVEYGVEYGENINE